MSNQEQPYRPSFEEDLSLPVILRKYVLPILLVLAVSLSALFFLL